MEAASVTTAFAVWAAVVGMIGGAIVWELARLRNEVRSMAQLLQRHQLHTEARLTAGETHLSMRDGFNPSNHFGLGAER
jgi:CRP-like cAMP-binding protein